MQCGVYRVVTPEEDILIQFCDIRTESLLLCEPLDIEDYVVQSMPDASPIKWHLAHTTWFFERFILKPELPEYRSLDARYEQLFNSYYQLVGLPPSRADRGLLTRPTVAEVLRYRRHVDEHVQQLLSLRPDDIALRALITLGLQHEQQHQELMLTDIKHAFASNPLLPAYRDRKDKPVVNPIAEELKFVAFDGGIKSVGASTTDFSFDNEQPQHAVLLSPFSLANRLVTNREYLAFVRTGGYRRPEYWLADGWQAVNSEGWSRPLYWHESLDSEFTLHGLDTLQLDSPVCHLSYYEADAFARWAGMRLPTEFEWEVAAATVPVQGNLLHAESLHPLPARRTSDSLGQLYGDVWEWTASAHSPYPGYTPPAGALGEYNGKFMCNQLVLRGGSCATPDGHIRATYRNFFFPHARWQFSGVRLAR